MTEVKYIEQGVEKTREEWCAGCAALISMEDHDLVGVCGNPESDHYMHLICRNHRACEKQK